MKVKKTTPEPGDRWGILGGTFDPVHSGHINLANQVARKLDLNGVFIVPAVSHPFKSGSILTTYHDRTAMLELALADQGLLHLLEIEKDNNLSGYTVDTLLAIKEKYPKVNYTFIVGTDNIAQIESWYHPEIIFREVSIAAGKRPGVNLSEQYLPLLDKIKYCEIDEFDISSTELREAVAGGNLEHLKGLVPDEVLNYIKEKELYINE